MTSSAQREILTGIFPIEKDRPDAREFGDWTRKGPLPDVGGQRKVSDKGGFGSGAPRGGGFDNASEAGSERGGRRGGFEPNDGKVRDFGNWDRKGPLTPTLPSGPLSSKSYDRPVSRDEPNLRRNSPAWGEGKSQDGSRPPRREFVERPPIERAPTAAEQDTQWRTKMKPDAPQAPPSQPVSTTRSPALSNRELSNPPSPAGAPAAPATRPKLNLAKRTVEESPDVTSVPPSDSKASPFGAARPIDTATREKEVEEKRQIAIREKKETEEKARSEKKEAEEKVKEEQKQARQADEPAKVAKPERSPVNQEKANGTKTILRQPPKHEKQGKENGVSSPPPGKNFQILQRTADQNASAADEEADEAEAAEVDGLLTADKETKPKEVVRDGRDAHTNGATANLSADPTAEALDGDGWSTVSKPEKKRKNGNQVARAIAS